LTSSSADLALLSPVHVGTPVAEATSDLAVLRALLRSEAALARALHAAGLIERTDAEAIEAACSTEGFDVGDLAARTAVGGNPAIPLVEALRQRVADSSPGAARWVHHGATSQDIVDTALMLVTAQALRLLIDDLRRGAGHTAGLVVEHRDTPMVARTLTQQALPTTFGAKASGWLVALTDAVAAAERTMAGLPVQLGGPVGILDGYGEHGRDVLDGFADDLGLLAPVLPWHTRRTPVLEVAHALQLASAATAKVAADVLVMSRTEVGELRDTGGGPSSAMAHKQNPVRAVLVAAAGRETPALLSVLAGSAAAEDERPAGAWHAEWYPWRRSLQLAGGAAYRLADLLDELEVDAAAMRRNLDPLVSELGFRAGDLQSSVAAAADCADRALAHHRRAERG
jgi:3-carboxy-cis,cis-muconate cycloisomerase